MNDTSLSRRELLGLSAAGTLSALVGSVAGCASTTSPRSAVTGDPSGGFHLVVSNDADIEKIATALRDRFKVAYVAPATALVSRPSRP